MAWDLTNRTKGILATVVAALLWSTAGWAIKVLPQSAYVILFYRSFFAALIFYILYRSQVLKITRSVVIGSILYAMLVMTFVISTKLTTAATAIFLQHTAPLYILVLEARMTKTRITPLNLWTVIVCMLGMVLFFMNDLTVEGQGLGIALAAFGGVLWAFLILLQRKNKDEEQKSTIFYGNMWVVAVYFITFLDEPWPSWMDFNILAYLGIVQLGLGFAFFTFGQKHISALESSLITMLEPLLNPVWVLIGYHEHPGNWSILGGLIIITALVARMVIVDQRRRKERPLLPDHP